MNKQFYKDAFGWGFVIWLIGYALGMMLFAVVPLSIIGWIIMPIGTIITLWVLFTRIKADYFQYYALLAIVWVLIAVIFDYFFLVKAFKPVDGYYKQDLRSFNIKHQFYSSRESAVRLPRAGAHCRRANREV